MVHKRLLTVILSLIVLCFQAPLSSHAQSAGTITGKITDADTGEPMPWASVKVQGTSYGALTSVDGTYRISNVPTGNQEIIVLYVGYKDGTGSITVRAGQTSEADIAIESETVEAGEVVVKGSLVGQARALNRQKNAEVIQNVISSEQVGRFPDQNPADALQRVPAVSISRDMGEGRYVMIRGMNPDLNSVSINGNRLPSPDMDQRRVPLDVIPADLIGSLEVNKSITPDMDADAVGGSVNIVTKAPHDYQERTIKGTVAGGFNLINDKGNSQVGLTYAETFDKIGVLFSGNYTRTDRATHNNKFKYTEEDINGTDTLVMKEFRTQDYEFVRTRIGLSATVDYSFDDNNRVYFQSLYNNYDDDELRRGNGFLVGKGDYTSAYSVTDGRVLKHLKDRQETQQIMSYAVGGEHFLSHLVANKPIKLDYQLAYSYADEVEEDRYDSGFVQKGIDMSWDKDSDYPKMTMDTTMFNDYSAYELDELEYQDNKTTDTDISGQINIEVPLQVSSNPLDVKAGAKFRLKSKDNSPKLSLYEWDGSDDYTLDQVLGSYTNNDYMDGDMGELGKYQDYNKIIKHFKDNTNLYEINEVESRIETDTNTYEATENILAAYGMAKYTVGSLSMLGGLRIEQTSIEYDGYQVEIDQNEDYVGTTKKSGDKDYLDFFPTLQAKYAVNNDFNIRAAFTTSLSRPNYFSLVPYNLINRADEEIERGNPDLDPTRVYGFDLLAEHYFRPMGILSAGIFYKNLDEYLFESVSKISGGQYDGYEVTQWINGDAASLMGIEANWSHQLTFLPGYFSGLGIYANYTFTDSEATVKFEDADRTTELAGQSQNMGNFALSYENFGFIGRISLNHQSKFLSEVGEESGQDYYIDDHTQLDISLSQKVYTNTSVFLEIQNLTDEPLREYEGDSDHPRELEFYGRWINFGVKIDY